MHPFEYAVLTLLTASAMSVIYLFLEWIVSKIRPDDWPDDDLTRIKPRVYCDRNVEPEPRTADRIGRDV